MSRTTSADSIKEDDNTWIGSNGKSKIVELAVVVVIVIVVAMKKKVKDMGYIS